MRFSLVMATVGRVGEVEKFLASLDQQTYRDFELIVVDQNDDERLRDVLLAYKDRFEILHLRSQKRGASRARNTGLRHATGDLLGFPDDDCWYPADLLERVQRKLENETALDGVTCKSCDEQGRDSNNRWANASAMVNRRNVWICAIEYSIFVRARVIQETGDFDETLGVGGGTPWGAGEGTDYCLRALAKGFRLHYDPKMVVHHPQAVSDDSDAGMNRALSYGRGMGRVLRTHNYPLKTVLYYAIRPLGGAAMFVLSGRSSRAKYYLAVFQGRTQGWLSKV